MQFMRYVSKELYLESGADPKDIKYSYHPNDPHFSKYNTFSRTYKFTHDVLDRMPRDSENLAVINQLESSFIKSAEINRKNVLQDLIGLGFAFFSKQSEPFSLRESKVRFSLPQE